MPKYITLVDNPTFTFRPSRFPDATLTYRRLTLETSEEINGRYRKVRHRSGVREVYFPEETEAERSHDLWDHVLVAWGEGDACAVRDKADRPLPCDRANKVRFFEQYPDTAAELLTAANADIKTEGDAVRPT
jgi:hypothetical protein